MDRINRLLRHDGELEGAGRRRRDAATADRVARGVDKGDNVMVTNA